MSLAAQTPDSALTSAVVIIKPQPASHGRVIRLGAIDQIAPRDYISVCLFFPLSQTVDKHRIFRMLELAMLRTVNDIPELACCVQKHTGTNREEVELLYDVNEGVEIHYKDYTSPALSRLWKHGTFQQLEQQHFPMSKMGRHLIFGTSAKLEDDCRLPSLVMQANFIPGGLIIGTCLHHVAGDGVCNIMWHSLFGSHLAAIADGLVQEPFTPLPPIDRHIIGVTKSSYEMTLDEFPDWKVVGDTKGFLNPTSYGNAGAPSARYAMYFISSDKITKLKNLVASGIPDIKISLTEVLAAFLWRHVILARGIDAHKYPEAKLSLTIDARGRMEDPKIPANYWGNFAEPNAVAKLPVATLQKDSKPSPCQVSNAVYFEAARHINKAIYAVDNKAVRRLIGLLNQMPKSTSLTWNVNRYPGPDMLIVCTQGHRFNDIYFGRDLGYSRAMRFTVGDTEGKPDGRCAILPPRRSDRGGLEVLLQYDEATLRRLGENADFTEFFVRRN